MRNAGELWIRVATFVLVLTVTATRAHAGPVPASCMDQVQNGSETDVDCGGECPPCAVGLKCNVNSDCESGICSPTTRKCLAAPTATATATSTVTATQTSSATPTNTPTPQPKGSTCTDAGQCVSGNCVDTVCCDTACTSPQERCDLPGQRGSCTNTTAPAPALTRWGLLAAAAFLASAGAFTLRRRTVRH